MHACTIGDNSLIGMGATVLDGAKVESGAIVAAGSVVSPRTVVPSGQVWRICGMCVGGDIQPYGLHYHKEQHMAFKQLKSEFN